MKTKLGNIGKLIVILTVCICFTISCDFSPKNVFHVNLNNESIKPDNDENNPFFCQRKWSIVIYMAADNDLEFAALQDICEMELSNINTDIVSVFMLVDTCNSLESSDIKKGNTKLYRLKTNKSEDCKTIISEEIICNELNLNEKNENNLNMASGNVLSNLLSFIIEKYPAEYFGMIMWGHGTGFRGQQINYDSFKGFAYDDSFKNYMTLKQLVEALKISLKGRKLDFIGFDTCFSSEIEVMYELKDVANYSVGTEGLIYTSGWNYRDIFNNFENDKIKTPSTLINNIIKTFSKEYSAVKKASIGGIDLKKMNNYFLEFDKLLLDISHKINSRKVRDDVINILFNNNIEKTILYKYEGSDSDVYLDINSMIYNLVDYFYEDKESIKKLNNYKNAFVDCVFNNWSSDKISCGLGVYFGSIKSGNLLESVHPESYIKNDKVNQLKFVQDSEGYVPSKENNGSLLNKLFYTTYKN